MNATAEILANAHRSLTEAAAATKRAAAANRRILRDQRTAIAALEAEAKRLGLSLKTTKAEEVTADERNAHSRNARAEA